MSDELVTFFPPTPELYEVCHPSADQFNLRWALTREQATALRDALTDALGSKKVAEMEALIAENAYLADELRGMSDMAVGARDYHQQQIEVLHTMICNAVGWDSAANWPGNRAAAEALSNLQAPVEHRHDLAAELDAVVAENERLTRELLNIYGV